MESRAFLCISPQGDGYLKPEEHAPLLHVHRYLRHHLTDIIAQHPVALFPDFLQKAADIFLLLVKTVAVNAQVGAGRYGSYQAFLHKPLIHQHEYLGGTELPL